MNFRRAKRALRGLGRLPRARNMTVSDVALLGEALLILPTMTLLLKRMKFKRLLAEAREVVPLSIAPNSPPFREALLTRVPLAVARASAYGPVSGKCLSRSLTVWLMLRRRGIDTQLRIGARFLKTGAFSAHAWVEIDGKVVNDRPTVREAFGTFDADFTEL